VTRHEQFSSRDRELEEHFLATDPELQQPTSRRRVESRPGREYVRHSEMPEQSTWQGLEGSGMGIYVHKSNSSTINKYNTGEPLQLNSNKQKEMLGKMTILSNSNLIHHY
jgi:hypothetical protein